MNKELDSRIAKLLQEMSERPDDVISLLTDYWYEAKAEILNALRDDLLG